MTTSAQAFGTGVVKSGWLQRQSDFLRRWKRSFCVLHNDGRFIYYTSEKQKETEGMLQLKNCYAINVGKQVEQVQPPAGFNLESVFLVKTPENNIVFCADSSDDVHAWKSSMLETKQAHNPTGVNTTYTTTTQYNGAPPPYNPAAPQGAPYYAAPPPAYAQAPPPYAPAGQQTVTTTPYAPVGQQTLTTTTYRNGNSRQPQQQVIVMQNNPAPANNGMYPTQTTAYSYPGQTTYTTYGAPTSTTVIPGQSSRQMTYTTYGAPSTATTMIPGQNPQQQHHQTIIYQQQQPQRNNNNDFIAGAAVGMCMMPLLLW